ncbi:fatty acid desaturase family protein [Nocardioides litoris]|uniref:fatty acid desaturase family protein n=1 Tax=Nocardioides litoris TaxID=1926648 RepID=UPI0011206F8F|nr:acyl-CoA desaturase [Nocardioides litoris]
MTVTATPTGPAPSPSPHPTPYDHLSPAEVDALGADLDALREEVRASLGAADAAYIRRVIAAQRALELGGRLVLLGSRRRPAWLLGTACLTLAKVLDNMEIGHNVLHGQWDWMRDPKVHSSTWDWDHVSSPAQWQRAHNEVHHVHTNVLGRDNDLGYGILRVDEAQPWRPRHAAQPLWNLVNAVFFEYGIALYDLGVGEAFRSGSGLSPEQRAEARETLRRAGRQLAKDLVVWPLFSGRAARHVLAADVTALVLRNLWSHSVIMCGHFPEGVATFEVDELPAQEGRGEWYLRQALGSADVTGPRWLHLLTGNLSHQVEHHCFPDLPSNRYAELAPRVREVLDRHGLPHHAASLPRQVASAWHKVVRLSVPPADVRRGWGERVRRVRARRAAGGQDGAAGHHGPVQDHSRRTA